jgi:hypothetical protein
MMASLTCPWWRAPSDPAAGRLPGLLDRGPLQDPDAIKLAAAQQRPVEPGQVLSIPHDAELRRYSPGPDQRLVQAVRGHASLPRRTLGPVGHRRAAIRCRADS